jgi:hypothetical protein
MGAGACPPAAKVAVAIKAKVQVLIAPMGAAFAGFVCALGRIACVSATLAADRAVPPQTHALDCPGAVRFGDP